jgi:hypothetical protein
MHITIEHHNDQFNVNIHSKEGADAFLSIKGCRIKDGANGPFLSYPANKNERTGKWWNHVWGSDKFNAVVLAKAQEGAPKAATSRQQVQQPVEDDIPF